jgi:transcription initiation factor TFIIA large subunit
MDDDDINKDDDASDLENAEGGAEEEPLNSEDDVTDEDAADLFETENVVVCQYDKVSKLILINSFNYKIPFKDQPIT